MTSSVPKPLAEGTLSATPLGHVLLSIQKKGLSGTLAIWPDDERPGQDRLLFRSGAPAVGRFLDPAADLERAMLGLFHRHQSPYAFYEADLVGEGQGTIRGQVDILALIASALRADVPKDAMTRVIRKLGLERQRIKTGAPLNRLGLQSNEMAFVELMRAEPATAAILIEQFGDPKVAQRMLYLLAIADCLEVYRPVSQQKLKAVSSSSTDRASTPPSRPSRPSTPGAPPRGRYSSPAPGARESHLPPGDSVLPTSLSNLPPAKTLSGEIVAPREMPPPPPAGLSEEHRKRWEEVSRVIGMMDRQNYFEMLGVKESSDEKDIRSKYMTLAKKWHTDRLPPELGALRPWVEEVFHLITVANETLSDAKKRIDYQKTVMQGGGTPEAERKLNVMVEAAINFQKVDVLVKRRRYDEAIEICDSAMSVVRKEADYPAMKAWILLLRDGVDGDDGEAVANQIRDLLRKTFSLNPDHVHGHFVRAHFLKRMGDYEKAHKHFKKVAKLDPKNLEALREVRVGEMRKSRGRTSAPPARGDGKRPSIFGKFFKK